MPDFNTLLDKLTASAYETLLLHLNPALKNDLWPAWERGMHIVACLSYDGYLMHATRPPGKNWNGPELWRAYF